MNNVFNLNRFWQLFKKETLEKSRIYLLSIAVLFGITLLLLGFAIFDSQGSLSNGIQVGIFTWVLLGAGSVFTSLSFIGLGDKKQAISLLTLPASHFEKYLVQWIYSFILFQLMYFGIFYLADSIMVALHPTGMDDGFRKKNVLFGIWEYNNGICRTFITYAFMHALAFLGAIFFEKLHFIKTAFIFFIGLVLLMFINGSLLTSFINQTLRNTPIPFTSLTFTNKDQIYVTLFVSKDMSDIGLGILFLTAILLWASTFFKLKEKQV